MIARSHHHHILHITTLSLLFLVGIHHQTFSFTPPSGIRPISLPLFAGGRPTPTSNDRRKAAADTTLKRPKQDYRKTIAVNRQARRNYEILDTYEAGIALVGTEVKSIREGKLQLRDGYVKCDARTGQCMLHNINIGKHGNTGNWANHDETRIRRLLLHKSEGRKMAAACDQKGMTVAVLKAYFNEDNRVKIEIGVARGKNLRDKRGDIKERDLKRETRREMKNFNVG